MHYQLDLNWPDFIRHYWQKRPVIIRQGFPNFVDPLTPDELAGLAMESEIDSRLISYQDDRWQVSHGPFSAFDHLGEQNWSLLVQAVDHWLAPATALMKSFRVLPDWRLDDLMVSFSVPGGGVGPHVDQYDVFIIQGMGRRRWQVGEKGPLKQLCPHPQLLQVAPFAPIIDEEMVAGDILYIPPGFPHEGYALEESLNYSVGFQAPTACELVSSFADFMLAEGTGNERYGDRTVLPRETPGDILPEELETMRQMMRSALDQPDHFRTWFGQFISQSRHELDITPAEPAWQPDEICSALRQGEKLIRTGGLRVLRIGETLWVNGESVHSPQQEALKQLAAETKLALHHFDHALDDPAFLAILTSLINQGCWYFSADE